MALEFDEVLADNEPLIDSNEGNNDEEQEDPWVAAGD